MLQQDILFADRYRLIKRIGRGGFAEVWLAEDTLADLQVAIKIYDGMDEDGLKIFVKEINKVYHLNHTNLLKPQYVAAWNNMPYLVMTYCSAGSLEKKIGQITEQEAWKILHDVASGLAYLHSNNIIHQDIKPANILQDDMGNYVIIDFGISTLARDTLRKSTFRGNTFAGTLAYMGPERFRAQPAPTKASDIWSLGAMVYELLEGTTPFPPDFGGSMLNAGAAIPAINTPVSENLKQTIYKMLSKETWDRPTAATLVHWASNPSAINPKPLRATQPQVLQTPQLSNVQDLKENRKMLRVLGVILLCVIVGIIVFINIDSPYGSKELTPIADQAYNAPKTFHNNHEYIDLGLSVNWATCNVGASTPEKYGDYFAWGETLPKTNYTIANYKYSNNPTTLPLSADAAHVNWGGNWRIPTKSEQDELRSSCFWKWTTMNGIKGCKVTSKKNGNSIFLPAAGLCHDSLYVLAATDGIYWSSSLYTDYLGYANYMSFASNDVNWNCSNRYWGRSVRPVCQGVQPDNTSTTFTSTMNAAVDQNKVKQLLANLCKNSSRGGNYAALENYYTETISPYVNTDTQRKRSEIASTTKKFVESYPEYTVSAPYNFQFVNTTFPLTVKCDVDVTWAMKDGAKKLAKIQKTLYITSDYKVSGFTDKEFERKTIKKPTTQINTHQLQSNNHKYVDLGLSVKWATCNVGATKPEECGDYFAWGELEPKNNYRVDTYLYKDNPYVLQASNDIAYIDWGCKWRMPTIDEMIELRQKCTWTWTILNGIKGYKVTSMSNNNSIFLPASGHRSGTVLNYVGGEGYYWSSSIDRSNPRYADGWFISSENTFRNRMGRSYGLTIRPVCP